MRRTIIGAVLLVAATLADVGVTISASILATGSLASNAGSGKFWTAITENGLLFPFILAKLLFLLAIAILAREYFNKSVR